MAASHSFKSCGSNTALTSEDLGEETDNRTIADAVVAEASFEKVLQRLEPDLESLSVSKRLMRSFSQNLRKMSRRGDGDERGKGRRLSSNCLGLYMKGGGCRVGADTSEDLQGRGDGLAKPGAGNSRRNSSAGEECMGYGYRCVSLDTRFRRSGVAGVVSGIVEARADCFSYGAAERFWKRNSRKVVERRKHSDSTVGIECVTDTEAQFSLPDDILEMCLARIPLTTLMNVRLVCKKWRSLTTTSRFMQMRYECSYETPWLFLFGVVKDGYCTGQIQALDVSLDKWYKIDANIIRGRFLFSVAGIGSSIYIVGGCSSLINLGKVEKGSFKTHRGVVLFNPLAGSWSKVAPMKLARSTPVLGVFEVHSGCVKLGGDSVSEEVLQEQQSMRGNPFGSANGITIANSLRLSRSRVGGVSEVYGDPHRFSQRRQLRDVFHETNDSFETGTKLCGSFGVECGTSKFVKQKNDQSDAKRSRRFVLIVVGGHGSWDEPLDSGEIYDPLTNKWMDIARLPADFGVACSGAVCNRMFYVYSESDKLAAYDLEMGIWIGIQTVPSPPRLHEYFPKLVSCNGRLFVLCVSWGERDDQIYRIEKAVRKLWELDLTSHAWTEISTHPDAPMDWNAAFVADSDQIFGIEMFKIFGQVLDFLTVCNVSDSEVKWSRISRKHVAQDLDASSCMTKSMVVLHL